MPPRKRTRFEQDLAESVANLTRVADRQSSMLDRALAALVEKMGIELPEAKPPSSKDQPLGQSDSMAANSSESNRPQPFPYLTPRQIDVAKLLLEGLTIKQVAERIGKTESTVKNHRTAIYRALKVDDRQGLEKYRAEIMRL